MVFESCGRCKRRLKFYKEALRCEDCNLTVHVECRRDAPLPCIPKSNRVSTSCVLCNCDSSCFATRNDISYASRFRNKADVSTVAGELNRAEMISILCWLMLSLPTDEWSQKSETCRLLSSSWTSRSADSHQLFPRNRESSPHQRSWHLPPEWCAVSSTGAFAKVAKTC